MVQTYPHLVIRLRRWLCLASSLQTKLIEHVTSRARNGVFGLGLQQQLVVPRIIHFIVTCSIHHLSPNLSRHQEHPSPS